MKTQKVQEVLAKMVETNSVELAYRAPTAHEKLKGFGKNWASHAKIANSRHHAVHELAHEKLTNFHARKAQSHLNKAEYYSGMAERHASRNPEKAKMYKQMAKQHSAQSAKHDALSVKHSAWRKKHGQAFNKATKSKVGTLESKHDLHLSKPNKYGIHKVLKVNNRNVHLSPGDHVPKEALDKGGKSYSGYSVKVHSSVEEIAATKHTPEQEAFHSHPWIKKLKEQGFKQRKSPIPGVKLMKGGTTIDHWYRDGKHHINISHEHSKSRDPDAHTGWTGFGRHENIHEAVKAAKKSFKAGRAVEIKHIKSDEKWARREKERNNAKLKLDRIHQTKNIISSIMEAETAAHPHLQHFGSNPHFHSGIKDPGHHLAHAHAHLESAKHHHHEILNAEHPHEVLHHTRKRNQHAKWAETHLAHFHNLGGRE